VAGGAFAAGIVLLLVSLPAIATAFDGIGTWAVSRSELGVLTAGSKAPPEFDRCRPIFAGFPIDPGDPVYLGGQFTHPIPAGAQAVITVDRGGTPIASVTVSHPTKQVGCYADAAPIEHLPAGVYHIVARSGDETIGEGSFEIR